MIPGANRPDALAELCEPLFLYICRLNRSGRKGGPSFDRSQVRNEIKAIVRAIGERCQEAGLEAQFAKVRVVLLAFADFMIETSNLNFSNRWQRILHEENNHGGDEQFFTELDATLADPSPEANQRLAVFYSCLGLGFGGMYKDEPQTLNTYIARVASRLGDIMDPDENAKIAPEAYKFTNSTILQTPLAAPLVGATVAVVGLILLAFTVNGVLYYMRTSQLNTDLGAFRSAVESTTPARAK